MKFLSKERLSQHKYKTPEGYLVCVDAVLSRTGKQTYRRCEVFGDAVDDADAEVDIDRKPEEVFSPQALASFENKPIAIDHPNEDINVNNYRDYSVGFVRDIKRGTNENGQEVMLGTLVITDQDAISRIENGEYTDLSCGYDCDIVNNCQTNIRGNHVALCQQGRAGIAHIVDSKSVKDTTWFAVSDNDSGKYKSKEALLKDLPNFGDDVEVKVYSLAKEKDVQQLTSEDLKFTWKNGKIVDSKKVNDISANEIRQFEHSDVDELLRRQQAKVDNLKRQQKELNEDINYEKNDAKRASLKQKYNNITESIAHEENTLICLESSIKEYKALKKNVKDSKVPSGYKINNNRYEWEFEAKAKNVDEFLKKFKAKFPELYDTWGEEFEYYAHNEMRNGAVDAKENELQSAGYVLSIEFDENYYGEGKGRGYAYVIETKNRYEDSIKDSSDDIESIIENEYYRDELKTKQDILNRVKELEKTYGSYNGDILKYLERNGFVLYDSVKDEKDVYQINYKLNGNFKTALVHADNKDEALRLFGKNISNAIIVEVSDYPLDEREIKMFKPSAFIDSVKDAKWEVGKRVRYDGEWYYIINYSRGTWVLENENDRSQIRVSDSIKDDSYDWFVALDNNNIPYTFIKGGYGMKFKSYSNYVKAKELAKKYNAGISEWDDNEYVAYDYRSTRISNEHDSVKDSTLSEKMNKIDSNPKAVEMANNLLKNPNLKLSEVVELVYNKFFGNTNDSEIEGRVNPSEAKCNCDHPFHECGPDCDCGCKDSLKKFEVHQVDDSGVTHIHIVRAKSALDAVRRSK